MKSIPTRLRILAAILAFACAGSAHGVDGGNPQTAWESFRTCLRRGDYRAAYAHFSRSSQGAYGWEEFSREYQPVGVVCPLILSEPVESRMQRPAEDWAELHFAVVRSDGRPAKLRAALVREEGAWRLVAGRHEQAERWETETRRWLTAGAAASADPAERIRWLEAARTAAGAGPDFYRLERYGDGVRAASRRVNLQSFLLSPNGGVAALTPDGAPVMAGTPPPAAPAPATAAARPRPMTAPPTAARPAAPSTLLMTPAPLPGTASSSASPALSTPPMRVALASPADAGTFGLEPGFGVTLAASGAPTVVQSLALSPSGSSFPGFVDGATTNEQSWAGAFPAATRRQDVAMASPTLGIALPANGHGTR